MNFLIQNNFLSFFIESIYRYLVYYNYTPYVSIDLIFAESHNDFIYKVDGKEVKELEFIKNEFGCVVLDISLSAVGDLSFDENRFYTKVRINQNSIEINVPIESLSTMYAYEKLDLGFKYDRYSSLVEVMNIFSSVANTDNSFDNLYDELKNNNISNDLDAIIDKIQNIDHENYEQDIVFDANKPIKFTPSKSKLPTSQSAKPQADKHKSNAKMEFSFTRKKD